MSGLRPWHIVLLAVSVIALGVSVYFTMGNSDGVELADSIVLVDLESGELLRVDLPKNRAIFTPAVNKVTKKRSLFPVAEKDGKWYVSKRYVGSVKEFVPNPEAVLVDAKTGEVKVANQTPKHGEVDW